MLDMPPVATNRTVIREPRKFANGGSGDRIGFVCAVLRMAAIWSMFTERES